jgi:hypothetical protein
MTVVVGGPSLSSPAHTPLPGTQLSASGDCRRQLAGFTLLILPPLTVAPWLHPPSFARQHLAGTVGLIVNSQSGAA